MEIKIDTTKDSKEDIKRAIEFLKHFIEQDYQPSTESMPDAEPSMFNMFSGDQDKEEEKDDKDNVTIIEY